MTCGSCKNKIETSLSSIEGVTKVNANLETKEVEITTDKPIAFSTLQNILPTKYTLLKKEKSNNTNSSEKSKFQQLKPLFLTLGYIATASFLLHYKNIEPQEIMLDFMGLFYIVFSFFKILDLKGFPVSFKMYDPLAKKVPFYANIYPFIEVTLGLFFLFRFQLEIALIATIIILGITTFGVVKTLLDKKEIKCACLGTVLNLPMTEATFIENAIMIVMAIVSLIFI